MSDERKEPPERDWSMIGSRFLWFSGAIFFYPWIVLPHIFYRVGPVACVLFVGLTVFTLRMIGFGNIVNFLGLLSLFGLIPHREREQVTVYNMKIREDSTGERIEARLKGHLTRALPKALERVQLRGRFRDDVFMIRNGFIIPNVGNRRPRIALRENHSWVWFTLTIAAYGTILWVSYDRMWGFYNFLANLARHFR